MRRAIGIAVSEEHAFIVVVRYANYQRIVYNMQKNYR
jgi:hypothetical protein